MRIIGYIEHPELKITVFKMDDKLSVKFENGFFEQTVKIRSFEGMASLEDISKLIDQEYIGSVIELFRQMEQIKQSAFRRLLPEVEIEEFEKII
jgi:hypothetical protein